MHKNSHHFLLVILLLSSSIAVSDAPHDTQLEQQVKTEEIQIETWHAGLFDDDDDIMNDIYDDIESDVEVKPLPLWQKVGLKMYGFSLRLYKIVAARIAVLKNYLGFTVSVKNEVSR